MKVSEKDIAAVVRKHLESQGLKVRSEVPVVLPDIGRVTADLVACRADPEGDSFTVVECKRKLDATLEAQCRRWLNHANEIYAVYLPFSRATDRTLERLSRLHSHGIGRATFSDGALTFIEISSHSCSDDSLVAKAFYSHDGSHDAVAGIAAAKRMTPERCRWEALRKLLNEAPGGGAGSWRMIRRLLPEMRRFTPAQVRRAIDRGECVGIAYRGTSITEFYATEKK